MNLQIIARSCAIFVALFLNASTAAQTLPQQFQWTIATPGDFMFDGRPLGDVDGDGRADVASVLRRPIIMGTGMLPTPVAYENHVEIRSGADGSSIATLGPFLTSVLSFVEVEVLDAGDVNGDGHDDIVVANSREPLSFAPGSPLRSDVFVFSGFDGSVIHHWEPVGSPVFGYGADISGGKDFDGDGVFDVLIGQELGFNNGATLEIRSGATGSILQSLSVGTGSYASSDWVGDVNADGILDVAVGTFASPGNKGEVRVLSGFDNSVLLSANGQQNMDYFGSHLSNLGDVNGDGLDDLLVYALDRANLSTPSGGWFGVFEQDGSLIYEIFPAGLDGYSQDRRSSVGDLNGDGVKDFSARLMTQRSPLGPISEFASRIFSGADGSVLSDVPIRGTIVSDTNGDGIAEFMWSTFPNLSLSQPIVTVESFMGVNAYGAAPAALTLAWEPRPQRPQWGDYVVDGATPNAMILAAVSAAPANGTLGGTGLPLYLSPLPADLILTANVMADSSGQYRVFESLSKPALAGFRVYLQVAETSPFLITSNALEVRFGP
ncbi:MAG: VCBS repeat-containing protein [Planctomycetota bacterium]